MVTTISISKKNLKTSNPATNVFLRKFYLCGLFYVVKVGHLVSQSLPLQTDCMQILKITFWEMTVLVGSLSFMQTDVSPACGLKGTQTHHHHHHHYIKGCGHALLGWWVICSIVNHKDFFLFFFLGQEDCWRLRDGANWWHSHETNWFR